jgi:ABC-2 type transport system ATP-binding protein
MTETAVKITGLSKTFKTGFLKSKEVRALDDLSLDVPAGQIFGFLGGNGAGKTTTIKILMGLLFPTSGTAEIFGRGITETDVHAQIGYCPENPYFYDYLTPLELMNYFGSIFGLNANLIKGRTGELLTAVGLSENDWKKQLRKFSKGMLQRVGLAQSLINDPGIVFLDEPMSGLDPIGRREIRELIAGLRDQGKTVFMSTHILSDIEALCDEVAILKRGKLAAKGHLQQLLAQEGASSNNFEIIVTNVDSTALQRSLGNVDGLEFDQRPSGSMIRCQNESDIDVVLSAVRANAGNLVSIQQVRQSLEDLFTRDI